MSDPTKSPSALSTWNSFVYPFPFVGVSDPAFFALFVFFAIFSFFSQSTSIDTPFDKCGMIPFYTSSPIAISTITSKMPI